MRSRGLDGCRVSPARLSPCRGSFKTSAVPWSMCLGAGVEGSSSVDETLLRASVKRAPRGLTWHTHIDRTCRSCGLGEAPGLPGVLDVGDRMAVIHWASTVRGPSRGSEAGRQMPIVIHRQLVPTCSRCCCSCVRTHTGSTRTSVCTEWRLFTASPHRTGFCVTAEMFTTTSPDVCQHTVRSHNGMIQDGTARHDQTLTPERLTGALFLGCH